MNGVMRWTEGNRAKILVLTLLLNEGLFGVHNSKGALQYIQLQTPDDTGNGMVGHIENPLLLRARCRFDRGIHSIECLELFKRVLELRNRPLGGNVVVVAQVHSPFKYLVANDRRCTPATTCSCRTTRNPQ